MFECRTTIFSVSESGVKGSETSDCACCPCESRRDEPVLGSDERSRLEAERFGTSADGYRSGPS